MLLECLFLRACWRLTDGTAKQLSLLGKRKVKRNLEPLKRLDLGGCSRMTGTGLQSILLANTSLEELDLRGMSNAIDNDLLTELRSLPALKSLLMYGMDPTRVTQEAIDRFIEEQPSTMHVAFSFRKK